MDPFKENFKKYLDKGLSVIPEEYGTKKPIKGLKGWSAYCDALPNKDTVSEWEKLDGPNNIGLCLGPASGVVALDIDTDDPEILDIILPLLPPSPCEKKGAKGFTRFYRFLGEKNKTIVFNGKVVLEILSSKKKTTIPPSKHPDGMDYTWTESTLHEVDVKELPVIPPFLMDHISARLRLSQPTKDFVFDERTPGRNNELSSLCGELIGNNIPLDEAITRLIEKDSTYDKPLFKDIGELGHDEVKTNALKFYVSHLNSINIRRWADKELYAEPLFNLPPVQVEEPTLEKEVAAVKEKAFPLPKFPEGLLLQLYNHILSNSFVPQPAFATGAALALMGTLVGRKINFAGSAPNIYCLNLGPSGCGKDAPQQIVKRVMMRIGAESMLGCGDYVSDASLMDQLPAHPSRLDIIDEASGLLRSVSKKASSYNAKMGEILCELYTASTSVFTGRMTAMGPKGYCVRPNINLLCSTTPSGFSGAITTDNLESGLLGRFIVFQGDYEAGASMKENYVEEPEDMIQGLKFLRNYRPTTGTVFSHGEFITTARLHEGAKELQQDVFSQLDGLRRSLDPTSLLLPIAARLFQFYTKLALLSAVSNPESKGNFIVRKEDVEFAYGIVMYYYSLAKEMVDKYVHKSPYEKVYNAVYGIIKSCKVITLQDLNKRTKFLKPREREEIINDLLKTRTADIETTRDGQKIIVYNPTGI